MTTSRLVALAAFTIALGATSEARADDVPARPTTAVRIRSRIPHATLQEKSVEEKEWRTLCRLPCRHATPVDASAEHRVFVDNGSVIAVSMPLREGEVNDVEVAPAQAVARIGVAVTGAVTAGTGIVLMVVGLFSGTGAGFGALGSGDCHDDRCVDAKDARNASIGRRQDAGEVMALTGLGLSAVGILIAVAAAAMLPTSGTAKLLPARTTAVGATFLHGGELRF